MMGQPSASVLAMKMYKEQMKHPHSLDSKTVSPLIDPNRMAFLKSASNHQRQLVQGLGSAGLNQGVTGLPLKGWPLTGIDHLWPSIGGDHYEMWLKESDLTAESSFTEDVGDFTLVELNGGIKNLMKSV
ncbi:hypothetical protein CQW23_15334 [Capsicum baccatum]|uniref:Uncharacterized protein n=1 Tax=Capsicum baccatum TaxID=33114 RepID=A0A2G2WLR8_CAPBA|nr:hypothetical protein CQW23_15334 [Capsicum baccatum]